MKKHPKFAGGRVALGKIYLQLGQDKKAAKEFEKAIQAAPDNILAQSLLGETLLKLKRPKEALGAYKRLLYLSPESEKAQQAVQKLESLTADEYEEDIFSLKPLSKVTDDWHLQDLEIDADDEEAENEQRARTLERILSLADAYIVRNDMDRAVEALNEGERLMGPHPELVKRLKLIHHRQLEKLNEEREFRGEKAPVPTRNEMTRDEKIDYLKDLLKKVTHRRMEQ